MGTRTEYQKGYEEGITDALAELNLVPCDRPNVREAVEYARDRIARLDPPSNPVGAIGAVAPANQGPCVTGT